MFRAISDPSRRLLLDLLAERDGQTLSELEARLDMTRFGVMKHLRVLEEAGLVTTHRAGRHKLHFLNPTPIQLVAERWISKYAAPFTTTLSQLKHRLEDEPMSQDPPRHVYSIVIQTTPEKLWAAITDPEMTRRYYHATAVNSDWKPGSHYTYTTDDGSVLLKGEILEIDPPRRLVTSFDAVWDESVAEDPPSRLTWEIEPMGDTACRLTCTHDGFAGPTSTFEQVSGGMSFIVSGLKTLLETGEPLLVG